MARRKRIPYKPDAFQSYGRAVAAGLLDRGRLIVAGLVLAAGVFVVAVVIVSMRSATEENSWAALDRAGRDLRALRAALAEYGSASARPFLLLAVGRGEIEPPREDGKPRQEAAEEREARLARAEKALGELVDDYPGHFLHVYALGLRGQVLEEQGRYRDAAAAFELALKSAPNSMRPKIEYDIGRNYYLAGMHEAARSHLERMADAGRTVRVEVPIPGYGIRMVEQEADWIQSARYLLARIGPGERAVSLEEPEKKQDERPEEKPEGEPEGPHAGGPAPEKALDEKAPAEKKTGDGAAARPGAGDDAPAAGGPADEDAPEGE